MTTRADLATCAEPEHDGHLRAYRDHIAALTADYDRAVDTIMTTRYGPDWATRGDLPDDAYTTETVFTRWLNDLLDHIDGAAEQTLRPAGS